jgi:hypothetical protein
VQFQWRIGSLLAKSSWYVAIKSVLRNSLSDIKQDEFRKMGDQIPMELSLQMGRCVFCFSTYGSN